MVPPPSVTVGPGVGLFRNGSEVGDPAGCINAACNGSTVLPPGTGTGVCKVGALGIGSFEFGFQVFGYTFAKNGGATCVGAPVTGGISCSGSFDLTIYKEDVEQTPPPRCLRPAVKPSVGKPVDVITGNMWLDHTDISLPGAPGVNFVRAYNSLDGRFNHGGGFGRGWFHSYEGGIAFPDPGIMQLRQTDGTVLYFRDANSTGHYDPMIPVTERSWVEAVAGTYVRHIKSGTTETYDSSGRLTAMTDDAGRATNLAYDNIGRLTTITGSGGRGVTLSYFPDGKIESLIGPAGRMASYTYDSAGALESVAYADGTGYRFSYDGSFELLSVVDFAGHVVERHQYQSGKAITSELADGQEKYTISYPGTNSATVVDGLGNQTNYKWYHFKGSRQLVRVEGPCAECGSSGDLQTWTYDVDGRVLTHTDQNGTTTYTYHPDGEIQTETDALGRTTSYTYDSQGRILTKTDPGGHVTTYVHGSAGPTSITDSVTSSQNRTTSMTYNALGLVDSITDPRGKLTTMAYDGFGQLTSVTDPLTPATTFGYDSLGRRTTVTDALSHTTTTQYDPREKVTRITNHDGTFTSFGYDNSGRRTSVHNPLGRTTYYVYDSAGRLSTVVDPMNGATRYGYDAMSRMTSLKDAKGNTTTFDYDTLARVTQVTYPGGPFETLTYDSSGRLQTKTDRKSVTTTYGYDLLARLTGKTYSDGTTPAVTYSYDTAGRLATAANGTDTLTWAYDLAGQLLSEQSTKNASNVEYTYDPGGNRLSVSLDGTLFVSYAYDDASRLTTITRGSNAFGLGYDNANRRTSMTYPNGVNTSYSYDTLNRLTNLSAVKTPTTITNFTYTYDAAGNRLTKQQPDYTETYGYDPLYRLTGVERTGSLTGIQTFSYDPVGNRLTAQKDGAAMASSYNERNQLLSSAGGGQMLWRGTLDEPGTVSFTSATVNGKPARMLPGNVFEANLPMQAGSNTVTITARDTSGNVATKSYSVDVTGDGATNTYDLNGNLTQKTEGGVTTTYEWNAENKLTRVLQNGNEIARFSYDPLGRRVEKVAGSVTTSYTYDRQDILRETTSTGTTLRYIDGPGIDEPLAQEAGAGTLSYFHVDGLGSIVTTTNSAGAVLISRRYDAFGNLELGTPNGFGFAARESDSDTGLYYLRARYFDPKTGRFISEDPIRFAGGVNYYVYAENAPTLLKDPTGLFGQTTEDDDTCLICTVYAEGRGENTFCQHAIASVIVNRLANARARLPNGPRGNGWTICDIVSMPDQFAGYGDPNYRRCATCSPINPGELEDLRNTINNFANPFPMVTTATHFHAPKGAAKWIEDNHLEPVALPCINVFARGRPWTTWP